MIIEQQRRGELFVSELVPIDIQILYINVTIYFEANEAYRVTKFIFCSFFRALQLWMREKRYLSL
jgi:hypothetical protein